MDYQFLKIEKAATDLPALAAKYKALRLNALRQSPGSFSSTHEIESQFPDSTWISRIRAAGKETFICVATSGDGESEWVAQVTLRGPIPCDQFQLPEASGQGSVSPDDEEEKWQMLSLYTLPDHRGRGLGKRLCRTAFDFLTATSPGETTPRPSKVKVRIMIKPDNAVSLAMYRSLGFEQTGLCTLEEGLRANGEEDFLPEGELGPGYTTRAGIIMALDLTRR